MKEILGIISVVIAIVQMIPYIRDILNRTTKPHLFTYLVWSIVTGIAFLGQLMAGGGPGAWTTGVMTLLTVVIFLLCFKYGTEDVTTLDTIFFVAAVGAIVPWWFTHDPFLSVILATVIDVLAFLPTIRKTYNDPSSETLVSYQANLVRHPLSILALSSYSITTVIYPAALFVMNSIVVYVIISGRRKTQQRT